MNHFVRGFIDGDGSIFISQGRPRFAIYSGSKGFIPDLVKEMGWKQLIIRKDKQAEVYTTEYSGKQVYYILSPLYENSNIYLERKYTKFIEIKKCRLK